MLVPNDQFFGGMVNHHFSIHRHTPGWFMAVWMLHCRSRCDTQPRIQTMVVVSHELWRTEPGMNKQPQSILGCERAVKCHERENRGIHGKYNENSEWPKNSATTCDFIGYENVDFTNSHHSVNGDHLEIWVCPLPCLISGSYPTNMEILTMTIPGGSRKQPQR